MMNKIEALQIVRNELEPFRNKSYSELARMVDLEPLMITKITENGTIYQIDIQAFWDYSLKVKYHNTPLIKAISK